MHPRGTPHRGRSVRIGSGRRRGTLDALVRWRHIAGKRLWFGSAPEATKLSNDRGKGTAFDQLHRIKMHATFTADGIHRHDIRVMQVGGSVGFILEPLQMLGIKS